MKIVLFRSIIIQACIFAFCYFDYQLCIGNQQAYQNEILIELEGAARSNVTINYSRQLAFLNNDLRIFANVGIAPFVEKSIPMIPFGITIRSGSIENNALKTELGLFGVFGDESSSFSSRLKSDKVNVLDFLISWGLVSEIDQVLFKLMLGYVFDYSVNENYTVGLSIGYRF